MSLSRIFCRLLYFFILSTSSGLVIADDPVTVPWRCFNNTIGANGYGTTDLQACVAACETVGASFVFSGGGRACDTDNGNFGLTLIQGSQACADGDGYIPTNPDGTCPDTCPPPLGGADPYDTPDCGCSDPDYLAIDSGDVGPNPIRGCVYVPECPDEGTSAGTGCSGPNGVGYDHTVCLPEKDKDGNDQFCEADYDSDSGNITYNGGRATAGCSRPILSNTSDYGCDETEEEDDRNVGGDTEGTPDDPTIINDDNDTPDDSSDDRKTTRETTQTTADDGTTTDTTTTREETSDGTTTTTTRTTRSPDGTTTTTTTVTNPDGSTTTSINGTGGKGDCTGADCDDINQDGTGSTAGFCGKPPVCTGKPIECAMLNQEYNLQCGVKVSDHLDCKQLVKCDGDPIGCAIVEQNKKRQCFIELTEGLDESSSLEKDLVQDSGDQYRGTDGSNDIDVSTFMDFDGSGLGWQSSCPAPSTLDLAVTTATIDWAPLCDFFALFYPFILIAGFFHAGLIFFRGVTT